MTKSEALREIADELGISISKCVGILEALFESPVYTDDGRVCGEYKPSYDNIVVGKMMFKKFVKLAGEKGLLQESIMYCLPAEKKYTKEEMLQHIRESLSLPVSQKSVPVATKIKQSEESMVQAAGAELCVLEAQELMKKSWFPDKMRKLAALLAAENKSGKMKLRRVINQMYEPLVDAQDKYTRESLEYGIDQAIMQSAPNPNYVKKCARSYMDRNGQRPPALDIKSDIIITDDGRQIGKYDTWALNDERYREKFIEVFGGL
jgi:hypothetical protein